MPLINHIPLLPLGELGIWQITEDVDTLESLLSLDDSEHESMQGMTDRRKKEWLSARWLLHQMSGRLKRAICLKDEYGKPYIEDSTFNISISHSVDRTAVIASPYHVGIDIQEIVPKMHRIAKKFVSDAEWDQVPNEDSLEYLHVIWGAKEAMYKAWGKRGIDFRLHMYTHPFSWNGKEVAFRGVLKKGNIEMVFDVVASKLDQYVLVYCVEKSRNIYA